jgi:outer membrane murein-binding lipoprotein Lpp
MKRFLMLVAVAVVAGAMYVAASPASQQSRGPTAKQFKALKKQVATLSKKLNGVKAEADAAVGIIGACYLNQPGSATAFKVMMVSQRGIAGTGPGYLFGTSASSAPTTALDVVTSSPQAYLQEVDPQCATLSGLRHGALRSGITRLQHLVSRSR